MIMSHGKHTSLHIGIYIILFPLKDDYILPKFAQYCLSYLFPLHYFFVKPKAKVHLPSVYVSLEQFSATAFQNTIKNS